MEESLISPVMMIIFGILIVPFFCVFGFSLRYIFQLIQSWYPELQTVLENAGRKVDESLGLKTRNSITAFVMVSALGLQMLLFGTLAFSVTITAITGACGIILIVCSASLLILRHYALHEEDEDMTNLKAKNYYQDFETSKLFLAFVFACQTTFVIMVYTELYEILKMDSEMEGEQYTYFWLGTLFIMYLFLETKESGRNEIRFWMKCFKSIHMGMKIQNPDTDFEYKMQEYDFYLRMVPSIFANVFFYALIMYSIPLMLAGSENSMEFVVNCTAVVFIIELDDLSDDKDYRLLPGDGT